VSTKREVNVSLKKLFIKKITDIGSKKNINPYITLAKDYP